MENKLDLICVVGYWFQMSDNVLTVTNSLKMKLSIVFGVIHMLFGIFLGLWNFV